MPKVGKKHFPYTPKGEKNAENYARSTGKQLQRTQPPKPTKKR